MPDSNTATFPPDLRRSMGLTALAATLQGAVWRGWLPLSRDGGGRITLALLEMLLLSGLLWQSWSIRSRVHSRTTITRPRTIATLSFAGLLLCICGDLVNRNFSQSFYAYGQVIEHSYLVDSVWFFLPGYGLWLVACALATSDAITRIQRAVTILGAGGIGLASFVSMVLPGTSPYVCTVTGSYSVVVSLMLAATLWLAMALGRRAWHVALGAALAILADALIGQFWLFGRGYYPSIAHLNFAVYFMSQALILQLPMVYLDSRATKGAEL